MVSKEERIAHALWHPFFMNWQVDEFEEEKRLEKVVVLGSNYFICIH